MYSIEDKIYDKLKVAFWCMLLAALLFAGLFTYQTIELNSERDKRIELERELSDCEDVDKMSLIIWNGNDTIYVDTAQDSGR